MSTTTESKSERISRYWKFIVALIGAVLIIGNEVMAVVVESYGDNLWTTQDTLTVSLAILTAVGVYAKANRPSGKDGVIHADLSDPTVDRYHIELDGPPENLIGLDYASFKVEKKD